ncbi:MAG: DUF1428 domain-containing protein [Xanthomonadales bacterium]|nr:DUF1428 domain-containing protein [Xanthomonadales bacterium]
MSYVDGYLLAVPAANKDKYQSMANLAADIFLENGATSVFEGWGESVPEGTVNSMHTAVLREADEVVVFSWVCWPDKPTRDAGMQRVMADERLNCITDMPFDGKRMIFGGFETLVQR